MENAKENFAVPKYQLASIYKGLQRLCDMLTKYYFFMTQADRIVYYNPLALCCNECIKDFCIAFDFQDERPHWYMKLVGDFHTLTSLVDRINRNGVLRTPTKKLKDETSVELPKTTEKLLLRTYEEIGKIDEDISKWRQVALSSKNVSKVNPL